MDIRKSKKSDAKLDKNPYHRRGEKIKDTAFKKVGKSVKAVAKDTNKTRRKATKARIVGDTVPAENPKPTLKKVIKKPKRAKGY